LSGERLVDERPDGAGGVSGRGVPCTAEVGMCDVGVPDPGTDVVPEGVTGRDVLGVAVGDVLVRDALLELFG
jgi:hypothetical protein